LAKINKTPFPQIYQVPLVVERWLLPPIAGEWNILEVVCYLVDADANIAYRIKRVLAEDQPTFERFAPERMLAALSYHDRDIAEELAIFDQS
jgi:hypothetical protein